MAWVLTMSVTTVTSLGRGVPRACASGSIGERMQRDDHIRRILCRDLAQRLAHIRPGRTGEHRRAAASIS